MSLLKDKVAIITGGGYGIGREIALVFAREGARIAIAARSVAPLEQTLADLKAMGCEALAIPTDVAKVADCDQMVARTIAAFGRVDILVNNAGIAGPTKTTADMEPAEWQAVIDTNLTGAWLSARASLPIFARQESGNIVNISSLSGRRGVPMRTPYVASKWAMVGLTQAWANEWGSKGIRVNCICPGPVENDRIVRVIKAAAKARAVSEDAVKTEIVAMSAMRRMVSEDEVARVALFLASEASAGLTGQTINVDAGIAMN
jgi:NAD(P)-dependent dehydrogenase (short-subunit alcohol dehydrogenase family)